LVAVVRASGDLRVEPVGNGREKGVDVGEEGLERALVGDVELDRVGDVGLQHAVDPFGAGSGGCRVSVRDHHRLRVTVLRHVVGCGGALASTAEHGVGVLHALPPNLA